MDYRSDTALSADPVSENRRTRIHLSSFLPSVIRNLAEGISTRLSRTYKEDFQLSVTEWRILLQLSEHQLLRASEIVDITAMEKSKVSKALRNLEANGFVSRTVDNSDKRCQSLTLTARGIELYEAIAPRVLAWEQQLLEALDVNEYRDLLYLLDKLSNRLKSIG